MVLKRNMKPLHLTLIALSQLCWLGQTEVIHLDVSNDGDVVIDIDTEPNSHQINFNHGIGAEESHLVLGEHDVDLHYEVHRGFLTKPEDATVEYLNFSNIPYAQPPLGRLRFKAPVGFKKNSTDLNLGQEDRTCPQMQVGWVPPALDFVDCFSKTFTQPAQCSFKDNWTKPIDQSDYPQFPPAPDPAIPPPPPASEDCLLLDVFVPKAVWDNKSKKKAPVIVWIYGGGYIFGWKSQAGSPSPLFDIAAENGGENFIYVAMNYRLGLFGWLGGSRFKDEGGTPNAGLHDQRFALQWVQEHIEKFGGDKNSVTVMGQSAGASSILHHVTSPSGDSDPKPEFKQAIMQSPGFFPQADEERVASTYDEVLVRTGASDLEELSDKGTYDLQVINAIMTYYSQYGNFKFGPSVDGSYVEKLPGELLLQKKYHRVPMLIGHTMLDGLLFTPPWIRDDDTLSKYIGDYYPDLLDKDLETIKKMYHINPEALERDKITKVMDLLDDLAIQCNNNFLTETILGNEAPGFPLYRYLFGGKVGIHGSDVFFTYYPTKFKPGFNVDPTLAKFMQRSFISFARNGDPNHGQEPDIQQWKKYRNDSEAVAFPRRIMTFGDLLTYNIYRAIDPMDATKRERCAFWQPAPFRPREDDWLTKQSHGQQLEL